MDLQTYLLETGETDDQPAGASQPDEARDEIQPPG